MMDLKGCVLDFSSIINQILTDEDKEYLIERIKTDKTNALIAFNTAKKDLDQCNFLLKILKK